MGCQGSKEGAAPGTAPAGEAKSSLLSATPDKGVPGKGAKTPQSTSSSDEVDNRRKSVIHKAPEYIGGRVDLTAPFDKATIGTFTRHGIAPARLANANSKAKINQRSSIWPLVRGEEAGARRCGHSDLDGTSCG